jgi:hypothetical protein
VGKPDSTDRDDATAAPKPAADGTEAIVADTVVPPGIPGTPVHLPEGTEAKAAAGKKKPDDADLDDELDDEDLADDELADEDLDEDDDLDDDGPLEIAPGVVLGSDDIEFDEEVPEEFEAGDDEQSPQTALFWADVEVDPIEVALPSGVGLTLRHYRVITDADGDEAEEAVFLAHKGKLHLFRTAEGLVDFISSDAPHDLTDVEGWHRVKTQCTPADVVADEDDRYELDLVVENLRGGHDAWDPDLVISSGEFARDVAFACELTDVLNMLAPGSPLDDLDEGLRDGGFMARRRLKKIGSEQAALAWRTVVGKITTATEWHD